MSDVLMSTYKRLPVTFTHGEGARLWDTQGNSYLDAISGIAVCSLGHAHPAISEALCKQAATLVHTSNLYGIANQHQLGEKLTAAAEMERAFFCNSGAEANEAAIKLARFYGHKKGLELPTIAVMENSFHGRTLATLSATGNRKVQAGFEPLVTGFVRIPYGNADALLQAISYDHNICAVLVEPIQGEGGVNIPSNDYLNRLRQICDQHQLLLMLDEIQTGMARTGKMFAHQHNGITPDVMTLAKALGNGVPIGACLASGAAAQLFAPGSHGSTFGGNPLACAAGLAVLETMEKEGIAERAARSGEMLLDAFRAQLNDIKGVVDIRGKGMMIGIELDRPCAELVSAALEQGLLINVTAERVIRLLPPLTLGSEEMAELVNGVSHLVQKFLRG